MMILKFNTDETIFEFFMNLIQSLLCDPNPNSPANSEAAKLFTDNLEAYENRVK